MRVAPAVREMVLPLLSSSARSLNVASVEAGSVSVRETLSPALQLSPELNHTLTAAELAIGVLEGEVRAVDVQNQALRGGCKVRVETRFPAVRSYGERSSSIA